MTKEDNLKPFNTLTVEEQREIAIKGAEKSVEVRRKKKDFKEKLALCEAFFTEKAKKATADEEVKKLLDDVGYDAFMFYKISKEAKQDGDKLKALTTIVERKEGKPDTKTSTEHSGAITNKFQWIESSQSPTSQESGQEQSTTQPSDGTL